MATETDAGDAEPSERQAHIRSITITTIATLAGVGAGIASWQLASGADAAAKATDQTGIAAFLGAVLVTYVLLVIARVDVGDFGMKDNLYVIFMTFALWFITWGVLLSAEAY